MSVNPRKILALTPERIEKGAPANITVFDPDKSWIVEPEKLHSKSHNTVFKGEVLKGKNILTISQGIIRYSELD